MQGLNVALLRRACRIFLSLGYPGGESTIPPAKRPYWNIAADQPLEALVRPPVCQLLGKSPDEARGYAWRLGSSTYPHLKLQAVDCANDGSWVFAVDTHDTLRLRADDPDAPRWAEIQAENRRLKEEIENAWEEAGLLTFNALLRRASQTAELGSGKGL
jgi:hypothetical protein